MNLLAEDALHDFGYRQVGHELVVDCDQVVADFNRHGFGGSAARFEECDGVWWVVEYSKSDAANRFRGFMRRGLEICVLIY